MKKDVELQKELDYTFYIIKYVDVLTHEAGHAFEAYTASRGNLMPDQYFSTSEVNEIHSMSMEFFTEPWMELFFGEDADKYRYAHLVSALEAVPYMVCVDEFQHRVYEEKLTDPMARRAVWRELEEKYLLWRNYDGNEFLELSYFRNLFNTYFTKCNGKIQ